MSFSQINYHDLEHKSEISHILVIIKWEEFYHLTNQILGRPEQSLLNPETYADIYGRKNFLAAEKESKVEGPWISNDVK